MKIKIDKDTTVKILKVLAPIALDIIIGILTKGKGPKGK